MIIQSGQEKIAKSLIPLQKNHAIFTKMLRKDHCLPVNAKFVSVGYQLVY